VVPYLADPFFAEIARSIELRCIAAGFRRSCYSSHGGPTSRTRSSTASAALKPAGVLLAPLGRLSDRRDRALLPRRADRAVRQQYRGHGRSLCRIGQFQLRAMTVEYLCRTGEPPAFFEMRTPANPNANKRRKAYLEAHGAARARADVVSVEGEGWGFEEIGRAGRA
jgi:DNA-binding LacI/PurR family transcriptional regulator